MGAPDGLFGLDLWGRLFSPNAEDRLTLEKDAKENHRLRRECHKSAKEKLSDVDFCYDFSLLTKIYIAQKRYPEAQQYIDRNIKITENH